MGRMPKDHADVSFTREYENQMRSKGQHTLKDMHPLFFMLAHNIVMHDCFLGYASVQFPSAICSIAGEGRRSWQHIDR